MKLKRAFPLIEDPNHECVWRQYYRNYRDTQTLMLARLRKARRQRDEARRDADRLRLKLARAAEALNERRRHDKKE